MWTHTHTHTHTYPPIHPPTPWFPGNHHRNLSLVESLSHRNNTCSQKVAALFQLYWTFLTALVAYINAFLRPCSQFIVWQHHGMSIYHKWGYWLHMWSPHWWGGERPGNWHCPKKRKNVLLMTPLHRDATVSTREDKKPKKAILDYNRNKGGIDNLDMVCFFIFHALLLYHQIVWTAL